VTPTVKGIVLILVSLLVFTVLDSSAKLVLQSLSLPTAAFFRYFFAFLISLLFILPRTGSGVFETAHPYLQGARGIMLAGSTMLNFVGLHHLQLAQTAAIFFTIPLWTCALSVPLLGEKVGVRRWAAVIVGFLGVLVIMRPGTDTFHWAMLFTLGASLIGAFYNILTRKVGGRDRAETSLLYVGLFGSLGGILPAAFTWETPQGQEWLLLLGMGAAGALGHFLIIEAHRHAPASVLAPFIYTQIIWMTAAGYLLFGTFPDSWTLVGTAAVAASGIYMFMRERTLGRQSMASVPPE
jgi:drug/metabolite transporter (DMT)-like permease